MLNIEIIFATESEQELIQFLMPKGSTIAQAIVSSGILAQYPEIDLKLHAVGVFSQKQELTYVLCDGDRIEIYRPLVADPKKVRRAKADVQKENKQFL